MRPTRRSWLLAALAVVTGAWATVVGHILLLVGVCGICAWLLGQQYRFLSELRSVSEALELTQTVSAEQTLTESTTFLTVTARLERSHSFEFRICPRAPVGADGDVETLRIDRRATEATETFELGWPVAGTFRFKTPVVTARDRLGLFEQSIQVETARPTVTVEPRRPRSVHVGEGGEPVTAGFGDHDTGRTGQGLEPAEVRKYVAGDAVRRIDWKATARLDETHVREFTSQTDRETQLFVDHRDGMATGPVGASKLAYARHVALTFVDHAEEFADQLGCQTVGDDGITGVFEPRADADHLTQIRRHLHMIEPTGSAGRESGTNVSGPSPTSPGRVRTTRERLAGDHSAFAGRVRPFFDRPDSYVRAITDRPLYRAVDAELPRLGGALWTVIVTDDEHRTELRETVKRASVRGPVLVFMTPTPLFEPGSLADLDEAYGAYVDFEKFRRELASLNGVSAFEVGPGDRLSTVLAEAKGRTRQTVRNK